jgi:hypothetical protein
VYSFIHAKYSCFCTNTTAKTHKKTSIKTSAFMYKEGNIKILVYMWNAPKTTCFCSANTIKTQANQCITLIKYYTYVFLSPCNLYEKYIFLQLKYSKNARKHLQNSAFHVQSMGHVYYIIIWNLLKVNISAVETQWKHKKTLAEQCISCIKHDTYVFLYSCENHLKYISL